ncbi:monofunctional biosynthetic peptidoglycan transglycosylase [Pontibaca salina]|uniref:Biosynthetic peptidoglycan transglycosylase n=1 Tax=Pontibaca salina TaxID=2795731 RepID=A0A934HU57_9RHOB|nr:monofunctional biosynthetic peptidoglycan transglycosylase [Pontibaca salina]MBI6630585.1 monofunctional biosynthetic peptidoglycan transglycosylase [Pontibaca salina]
MATTTKTRKKKARTKRKKPMRPLHRLRRFALRAVMVVALLVLALVVLFSVVNPPITHTMLSEKRRFGQIERNWVKIGNIAPVMARSAVAAEDANFCRHWGFDVTAIRAAMDSGARRGGSTISQQVVKNVFLWQGRSWLRKALETAITPAVEIIWPKRRIIEVYLNVAEMGQGIFGVEAAARHHFGVGADKLTPRQAALLAAALPDPRDRSAGRPSAWMSRRATSIAAGADTIRADGRAACFED